MCKNLTQNSGKTSIARDWILIKYIRYPDLIINLRWDVINHKFNSPVFEFK